MKIEILVDNEKSWFVNYAIILKKELQETGNTVSLIFDAKETQKSDICFLLSCTKLVKEDFLNNHKHNIVIHASDLPKGKGFTPLKYQIMEGKNQIVLTLFEAVLECDAGDYYMKDTVFFEGHELLDELQEKMANKIIEMAIYYVNHMSELKASQQVGTESVYKRRTKEDDKLDIEKSIVELFNQFRIADNENYPLWFEYKGFKYYIKIYKEN